MARKAHILAIASTVLMLGAAIPSAQALDISIGGASAGGGSGGDGGTGTSVSVGTADTGINATIGGGSNVATGNVGTGANGVGVAVGNTPGSLIETNQNGGRAQANVNLGGAGLGAGPNNALNSVTDPLGDLLDGLDVGALPGGGGGAGGGGGGGGATQVGAAFGGLAPADQQLLRARCSTVLGNPGAYAAGVVSLCRVIARL